MTVTNKPWESGKAAGPSGESRRVPAKKHPPACPRQHAVPVRISSVVLDVGPEDLREFLPLLRTGFLCETIREQNLAAFLVETLGLGNPGGMVRVILDEEPVGDIGKATLREGAVLTVAAAVPGEREPVPPDEGLLRPSQADRRTRTGKAGRSDLRETCFVLLKLCGILLQERGGPILRKGVLIEGKTVDACFCGRDREFFRRVRRLRISGEDADPAWLGSGGPGRLCDWIHLIVRSL